MRRVSFPFLILFLFYSSFLFCGEVALEFSSDRQSVSVGETFSISLKIKGVSNSAKPNLTLPSSIQIVNQGESTQIEMINGVMSANRAFSFLISPSQAGEFQIGPVSVNVKGQVYQAGPLKISVSGAGNQSPQANTQISANSDPVNVSASLSKKEVYIGEQVNYIFKLETKVPLDNAVLTYPEFKQFFHEDLEKKNTQNMFVNGQKMVVDQKRAALISLETGTLNIPPARFVAKIPAQEDDLDIFGNPLSSFRSKPIQLQTQALELNVKALPSGAPSSFRGSVGQFSLETLPLKNTELKVGESVELEIKVKGDGNLNALSLGAFPGQDSYKVYEDQSEVKLDKTGVRLTGEKKFKFVFLALSSGNIQIPSLEWSYFNPETHQYVTLKSQSITLKIKPDPNQKEISKKTETGPAEKQDSKFWKEFSLIIFGILVTLGVGLIFSKIKKQEKKPTQTKPKLTLYYSELEVQLKKLYLEKQLTLTGLRQLLQNYLGALFDYPASAMTLLELKAFFEKEAFVLNDDANFILEAFEKMDEANYSNLKSFEMKEEELTRLLTSLKNLEEWLKKREKEKENS